MEAEDWKYVQNQFEVATRTSNPLVTEIITDTWPKLQAVVVDYPQFSAVADLMMPARDAWLAADTSLANGEAAYGLATDLFEFKLAQLTVQPDSETNSVGVQWDSIVTSNVATGGSIYQYLLPQGRTGWSNGTYTQRLEYVAQFGARLAEQTTKPALVTLGATVVAWHGLAASLRTIQTTREGELTTARAAMDPLRIALCQTLHAMIGFGLFQWFTNPVQVASLVDLELLRESQQELPEPPADTAWTPATRTLSTTAMPANATRLEVWRLGPGGAPERLLIGEVDEIALIVPADFIFLHGQTYQLWLQARNSRGTSPPGPQQTWTA